MIHKIGFLLALAASVMSLVSDFEKKETKSTATVLTVISPRKI